MGRGPDAMAQMLNRLKTAHVSLEPSNPTAIDGDIKQITASKLRLD
ncbi:hypothetical protein KKB55_20285 [Myxococcota bacterium]|nr:hypothetical protein [Myxococcota bacterium]